ncbi:LOW QUALITY PROTEIN: elongator complex protein 4-like [Cyprinus carpio]|uniref:LOW QUALITY PROTEIN: elongator complex protein 4-like n=1 Tax=Cyprinus carpio TaxID=7962 RepID=A0A9Q9Y924_CYPCA|nr:LOW QUALITY PROTEIN: elongator complex protein 4-like [Cyprinus carpio]
MAAPVRLKTRSNTIANNTTSFQKKTRSKLVSIPGTRPSVQNGQLLVSSGVSSLDYVIGGGLAVGTLLLVEEDRYDSYSRMLLKYFLAEGVVCGHELFLASARDLPDDIMQELPSPIVDDVAGMKISEGQSQPSDPENPDTMKIAWRYQNQPKVQTALASSVRFGHYYDVSKTMEPELRQAAKCHSFYQLQETPVATGSSPLPSPYHALLKSIQTVIRKEGFDGSTPQSKVRNVLRLGLHSLGSVLWGDDVCCKDNPAHCHALTTFLYILRGLLRTSLSVAMVTVPSHLIQNRAVMGRIIRLSDTAIALESFKGSEKETNPLYKDYHGLLHVRQLPRLNCLSCEVPDTKDLAFKLKRKQFTIERLHLPPDLSETVSRVSKTELAAGCGSTATGNKHLDF